MLNILVNKTPRQQIFAITVLFILFANLIIGGLLLPYKTVQAILPVVDPAAIAQRSTIAAGKTTQDTTKWSWDKVVEAAKSGQLLALVGKAIWDKAQYIMQEALKFAWNRLRRMLLNMLVNDIVAWIQGSGKPRFVTDWQGFLRTAADKAAGQLIDKMGLGFLCSTFSFQLRLALSSPPIFDETATCTLSSAITNINSFMTDFSKGGWKGWITISESQNNYMGAYLMAADKKYALMAEAADAAKNEGSASAGFLGDKICREIEEENQITYSDTDGWKEDEIPSGANCTKWEIRTPGRQVGDAMQQALGIDIPWLISAKEFSEYAGAIVDAVINRAIREGISALTSTKEGSSVGYGVSGSPIVPGINAPASVSVNISSYDDANTNEAMASSLVEQQKLYKENLEKLIAEHQANLGILNNIKNSQINAFSVLKDTLQQSCPLPPGISQVAISSQNISSCSGLTCPCTAKAVEKIKVSSSSTSEGIMEKTTTQTYGAGEAGFCGLQNTTVSHQLISSTVAVEKEIISLNTEILTLKDKVAQASTANTDTVAYQQAAAKYMTIYETWQRGDESAATSTAEIAMKTAKQKAVASNQTLLISSSADFNEFLQQTMRSSTSIVQKVGDAQIKKGVVADCSFAQDGLYQSLCSSQATEKSYQDSLNSCIASRVNTF